jgi:hypothetical protein
MNKLVYIYVPHEFVIGQVVLKSFNKCLAVTTCMVKNTVMYGRMLVDGLPDTE